MKVFGYVVASIVGLIASVVLVILIIWGPMWLSMAACDRDGIALHRPVMHTGYFGEGCFVQAPDGTWYKRNDCDDKKWFELTGACGRCGNQGGDCICTADEPCDCGPHEPRTWPIDCWACKGTGKQDPIPARALSKEGKEG